MSQQPSFRQRLARNTAASLLSNGWTMVLTFLSLPIILRGLGTESFGVWVLVQTFSTTNGWLSVPAIGVGTSASRGVAGAAAAREEDAVGRAIGTALTAFAGMGVVFAGLMALGGAALFEAAFRVDGITSRGLRLVTLAFSGQILLEHVFLGITATLEGLQRVATARGLDSARKTAVAVSVGTVATLEGGLVGVAVASAAATGASTVLATFVLSRAKSATVRRPPRKGVTGVLRYAGTVSALTATGVLHRTMDRVIAGAVFGPEAVALVEIATQVQSGCTAPLSASTYPVLSATPWLTARDDRPALRALVERTTRYSVMLTLPIVALAAILAEPFVGVWVGDAFSDAAGLTQVAVLYVALAAPLQAGSNALQGIGQAGTALRASALAVAVNLIASIALAETIGLVGVFVGTIIGALVLVPVLGRSIIIHTGLAGWATFARAVRMALPPTAGVAAVAFGCVVSSLSDLGCLAVTAGFGFPVGAAAATRWSFRREERKELTAALLGRRTPPDSGD